MTTNDVAVDKVKRQFHAGEITWAERQAKLSSLGYWDRFATQQNDVDDSFPQRWEYR